jgi:hypothetical protein
MMQTRQSVAFQCLAALRLCQCGMELTTLQPPGRSLLRAVLADLCLDSRQPPLAIAMTNMAASTPEATTMHCQA